MKNLSDLLDRLRDGLNPVEATLCSCGRCRSCNAVDLIEKDMVSAADCISLRNAEICRLDDVEKCSEEVTAENEKLVRQVAFLEAAVALSVDSALPCDGGIEMQIADRLGYSYERN